MTPASVDNPYDVLAPHYRALSDKRKLYLEAVEAFIIESAPVCRRRMLDAGAGDGVRGRRLAAMLGVQELTLAEPSEGMIRQATMIADNADIWPCTVESLPIGGEPFDVITCLWNVLGHVSGRAGRIEGLTRMGHLLASDGRLFIDVNNRHNAAAYGKGRVMMRRLSDLLWPDERRGDVSVSWTVDGSTVTGAGHLFTPREIRSMIAAAGLKIIDEVSVDYLNGGRSRNRTKGQLLYCIGRATD